METETLLPKAKYSGSRKSNRRRRRHRQLGGGQISSSGRKLTRIVGLKGSNNNNNNNNSSPRYWRIKAIPRLRLVVRSPWKLLTKLKNAYIDFMLRLSGNVGALSGNNVFGKKRIPKARQVSDRLSIDAFEARLIFEISKALVASRELNPM